MKVSRVTADVGPMGASARLPATLSWQQKKLREVYLEERRDSFATGVSKGGLRKAFSLAKRRSWRRAVLWVMIVMHLAGAAVAFVILSRHEKATWDAKWEDKCGQLAHVVTKNFESNIKLVKVLAAVVRAFAINMSPPALTQPLFEVLAKETLAASVSLTSSITLLRYISDSQRKAFEAQRGSEIVELDGTRKQRQAWYLFEDLAYNSSYSRYTELSNVPGALESALLGGYTGGFVINEPVAIVGEDRTQYGVAYGMAIYERDVPENASREERLQLGVGGLSGFMSLSTLIDISLTEAGDKEDLVVKLVDMTDPRSGPQPLYVPQLETASGRNWTFKDYDYQKNVNFGTIYRKYNLWCRPGPKHKMMPTKAIGWAAALVLLGCILAQILWVQFWSMERTETDCKNALLLADQLHAAKIEAEKHNAAKSTFLTSISHEIRTPMNGVLGMLGLLLDTTLLTAVQRDYAETALSSGKALLSLVNDVLDLSKIEAGCMDLENIPFSLREEMDTVLGMFGELSRGKGIELAALTPEGDPQLVVGDPMRFRQVINNLVDNAHKFCREGHILVRIVAVPEDETTQSVLERFHAGEYFSQDIQQPLEQHAEASRWQTLSGRAVAGTDCCWNAIRASSSNEGTHPALPLHIQPTVRLLIWVEDSGIGIADKDKEHLFTPFVQADCGNARKFGGTGIGLNVIKKLVQLMSGQVTLSSALGAGTTFRLDMLLDRPPPSKRPPTPSAKHTDLRIPTQPVPPVPSHIPCPEPPALLLPTPSKSAAEKRTQPSPITPDAAAPQGLRALCIDNNGVRAEITSHCLRHIGILAEPIVVEGDAIWRTESQSTSAMPAQSTSGQQPPHVAFVELFPGTGLWTQPNPSSGSLEAVPTPNTQREEAKWTAAQLKNICVRVRRVDSRLSRQPLVPLMLLSNIQDPDLNAAAKSGGFAGVVTKPLRCANVSASLREVLSITSTTEKDSKADLRILKGKHFMVVDDNAVNRRVASKLLEKYGVVVTCKPCGEEAVNALKGDHIFDIIFMDIQMPGMDGHQATRAIRELEENGLSSGPSVQLNRKCCPILALTANVIKGSWEECKESGMDGFITKPIEEKRLLQIAKEFLLPITP